LYASGVVEAMVSSNDEKAWYRWRRQGWLSDFFLKNSEEYLKPRFIVVSGFAIVNPARLELRIRVHTASHGTLGSTAGLLDNASLGISRF
jgi:hypothetical protein